MSAPPAQTRLDPGAVFSTRHAAAARALSHMIRDFTDFAGLTPLQYAARSAPGAGVIEPGG